MRWTWLFLIIVSLSSCERDGLISQGPFKLDIPKNFPAPYIPEDNTLTWERIELGKRLFYDPILSIDSTISCASCHKQEFAFADNQAITAGVEDRLGFRNSMSLTNVAYHDFFLREGGVPSLEMQVLAPIQDHNEMSFNINKVAERLNNDSSYIKASMMAYDRVPDYYVITRAIAAFERTLISGNSKYDHDLLNTSEKRGEALFFSEELACASCHGTFLFTNQGIENNGLYQDYTDPGRYRLTNLPEDIGRFKVPTLRNIAETSPYMHDGSLSDLSSVIDHYASGGKDHPNKNPLISGFDISNSEKVDLINFLKSLSDQQFLTDTKFQP